ncbi:hypothetical protein L195_g045961 [Trifolium pratense]|uniref:Uncharacterized protein n=1 Tax=Trifolium pratense TaxID=57577 RepID=A0A2K3MGH3_TRIPR|nr:hypothetical protein L195_g045961 [Trifolium pratense]
MVSGELAYARSDVVVAEDADNTVAFVVVDAASGVDIVVPDLIAEMPFGELTPCLLLLQP